ncbi:hypothetical protein MEBOL_003036 [Melittangium boletus DSM 14713]|uniref:Uncharacterized protein n=1 Tax=Melittangium boletus DSM 14713 TaxID=1294270 RepID=A0A250IEL0_9BACT|nr:hypothetical protein MEBOL_003036 [Melittangium boletus DSM 14713]
METTNTTQQDVASAERSKAIRIMASSMFRELTSNGYSQTHIIDFSSELLQLLTDSLRRPEDANESLAKDILS